MDLTRLKRLDPYCWSLPAGDGRAPALLYGSEPLLATMDDKVLEQISNVARLPGLVGPAMTMPDAHWGYGFPIGGVAATRVEDGVVSPGGVGYDINCGVRLLRTNLREDVVRSSRWRPAPRACVKPPSSPRAG